MNWWILVADTSRAKFYSTTGLQQPFRLERDVPNPVGRAPAGPRADSCYCDAPVPARAAVSAPPTTDRAFAHQLADLLGNALLRRDFELLVLFAPAAFLAQLQVEIDPQVRKRLAACVAKDLLNANEHELETHVRPVLRPLVELE